MENPDTQGQEAVEGSTEKKQRRWVWVIVVVIVLVLVLCFCSYILVGPAIQNVNEEIMNAI